MALFVRGKIPEKNPKLIRLSYGKGHEIGSHGRSHIPLWELNYSSFDKELKTFKRIIKNVLGQSFRIGGFCAPTFYLDSTTEYALKCLVANEFTYDRSVFPLQTLFV